MERRFIVVAVDGGAASGKSSTSKAVADRFSLMHVDTGSHYRALTLFLLRRGLNPVDQTDVKETVRRIPLGTQLEGNAARIRTEDKAPTAEELRTPEVNDSVSLFAAIPEVRQHLFEYQRGLAGFAREKGFNGVIMEGRDIGSVIFPDADYKFFLFADETTRAARRAKEGQQDSVAQRDKLDASRKNAPLSCPEDARKVDTSSLTLPQVIDAVSRAITG